MTQGAADDARKYNEHVIIVGTAGMIVLIPQTNQNTAIQVQAS